MFIVGDKNLVQDSLIFRHQPTHRRAQRDRFTRLAGSHPAFAEAPGPSHRQAQPPPSPQACPVYLCEVAPRHTLPSPNPPPPSAPSRPTSHPPQAEIELDQLRREESGSALTARDQVRTVTAGWLIGAVLGWSGGLVLGCLFSPALGFMLVGARCCAGPDRLLKKFREMSCL